jgi:methylase of polypeptide subunit release factors
MAASRAGAVGRPGVAYRCADGLYRKRYEIAVLNSFVPAGNALAAEHRSDLRARMSRMKPSILLDLMRRHTEPYDVEYGGRSIRVWPGVLSPGYDWTGKFGVECLPAVAGRTFLEIGCGCGIVSLFAGLGGASCVVAVDISPIATFNTKFNFRRHGLPNAHVVQGNLFDAISARFDVVFFNAPFYSSPATDWLENAVTDEDYRTVTRFLADVKNHLTKDGRASIGFSDSGDEKLLRAEIDRAGLTIVEVRGDTRWGYNCKYYTLVAA